MAGKNLLADETSMPSSGGKNLLADDSSKPAEKSTGQKIYEYAEPVVETLGAVGGGVLGVPLGPVGTAAGAGLGYGGVKAGMRGLGQLLGYQKPQTFKESAIESAKDVATGAALEAGTTSALRLGEMGITGAKNLYKTLRQPTSDIVKGVRTEAETVGKTAVPRKEEQLSKEAERREVNLRNAQQEKLTKAENQQLSSLDKLGKKTNIIADDVANFVRTQAQKFIKGEKDIREIEAITKIKDPAFDVARNKQKSGQYIANDSKSAPIIDSLIKDVKEQISKTPFSVQSVLNKRLDDIVGREVPLSEAEKRAAQVRSSITGEPIPTTKIEPVNFDQFEHLRRILNDGSFGEIEGVKALDGNRMKSSSKTIVDAMDAFSPGFKNYLNKYELLSQNINKARDSVVGKQALREHGILEDSIQYDVNPQTVVNNILNGTQSGAKDLINLVGKKTPELETILRGYVRNNMEGMSAAQAKAYVEKMEGFGREFPQIYNDIKQVAQAKTDAIRLSHEADLIGAVPKKLAEVRQRATGENKLFVENNLRTISGAADDKVPQLATNYVTELYKRKIITSEEYSQAVKSIKKAQEALDKKEKISKNVKTLIGIGAVGALSNEAYKGLKAGFNIIGG